MRRSSYLSRNWSPCSRPYPSPRTMNPLEWRKIDRTKLFRRVAHSAAIFQQWFLFSKQPQKAKSSKANEKKRIQFKNSFLLFFAGIFVQTKWKWMKTEHKECGKQKREQSLSKPQLHALTQGNPWLFNQTMCEKFILHHSFHLRQFGKSHNVTLVLHQKTREKTQMHAPREPLAASRRLASILSFCFPIFTFDVFSLEKALACVRRLHAPRPCQQLCLNLFVLEWHIARPSRLSRSRWQSSKFNFCLHSFI